MSEEETAWSQPANDNPWYCLATVYGEQEADDPDIDLFLAAKNRLAWNRWMAAALSELQREELLNRGFLASELSPLSEEELTDFSQVFAERTTLLPPGPSGPVDFNGAHFKREVSFQGFVFPRQVFLNGAEFLYDARFDRTAFCGHAYFTAMTFARNVSFSKAAFSHNVHFFKTTFSGMADFRGCEFKSHASFEGVKFLWRAPDFRDAKLSEATEWHDAQWPPSPKYKKFAQDQVYAYERLKAEMERLKKHADEQFFFAKELRARRELERRYSALWLLNWAYEIFSGYGQSIGFPVFWLVALFAIGTDIFALAPVHKGVPLSYDVAAGLSLTNLLPLLPYKVDNDISTRLSAVAKIIGDLQSLLGVILLFLLGLALRNRFRMK